MRRCVPALAVLLALAAPAHAEMTEVTGIAPWDTLNIRAGPGGSAAILGALPPHGSGIEVLERQGGWARIRSGGKEGWVAARHLAPMAAPGEATPPEDLRCIGTEPFWSVEFSGGTARLTRMSEDGATVLAITERRTSRNHTGIRAFTLTGGGFSQALIAPDRACSDGMSDNAFRYSLILTGAGEVLSGCCNPER